MKWLNEKFLKLADAVSFGMGTPTNIFFWILAVAIWFALGVLRPRLFEEGRFLPTWFTSPGWNFPLNTITTLAELYIGFLVAAATNRSERELKRIVTDIRSTIDTVKNINSNQTRILDLLVKYQKKELIEEEKVMQKVEKLDK